MKRICVFCGSAKGARAAYTEKAEALGRLIAQRRCELVYGAGNIGLMGVIADACMAAGGHVIGVIPQALMDLEVGHTGIQDLRVVGSMHERKAMMAELSDGFVAMPGGFGTLEEFCEILTWGQLGIHRKPFGLLNVEGYYDHFLRFLDHAVEEKLLKPRHRALVLESGDPVTLLEKMATAVVPVEGKVISLRET